MREANCRSYGLHLFMAKPESRLVRAIVPALLLLVVAAVGIAVLINSSGGSRAPAQPAQTTPAPTPPVAAPAQTEAAQAVQPTLAETQPEVQPPAPSPTGTASTLSGLHAVVVSPQAMGGLGDDDPSSVYWMRVEFSEIGAGIRSISLTHHYDTIRKVNKVHVQRERVHAGTGIGVTPLALLGVFVDGQYVSLAGTSLAPVWRRTGPGAFEAVIADDQQQPVVRIERTYDLAPGSHDLRVSQRAHNLTDRPVRIRWRQFGPVEFEPEPATYGGDMRRVRFGYLLKPNLDPTRQTVLASDFLWRRDASQVLGPKSNGMYQQVHQIWPNRRSQDQQYDLAWIGVTNRYFSAVIHPSPDLTQPLPDKVLRLGEVVDRVLLDPADLHSTMVLRLTSVETVALSGGVAAADFGLYGGPQSKRVMQREDASAASLTAVGLGGIVVHNFGGMCAGCTFQWLTAPLLWLLHLLHDYILFDWALAIIFLVVIVRSILHPVTRWSQIRLQRFGKQMQELAPKQKKLQEKYGNDRKKMQEEMTKLWREEGVNPMGMVGCLPLLLQSPIWIALYAMLFFAVELRHQAAFFGVFQAITGGQWSFLGDLGSPDRAIYFGRAIFSIPLMGEISSINLLPVILGVVFFAHQKYLSPPTTVALTPEQQQQQKIMKVMMVVLFPIIMYNAPCGLAIYFIANSTIAIFENRWIRAHIDKYDLLNPKKKGPRKQGFIEHLREVAEQRQKAAAKARETRRGPSPQPRKFKER